MAKAKSPKKRAKTRQAKTKPSKASKPSKPSLGAPLGVIDIDLQVPIDAPREIAWRALTTDIGRWWPRSFFTSPRATTFVVEPKLGGRMYEDWGDGNGLVWATIIELDAPDHLLLVGNLTRQYGGPAHSFIRFALEARGDRACTFRLTDTVFGSVSEKLKSNLIEGWDLLFRQTFKPYVEGSMA